MARSNQSGPRTETDAITTFYDELLPDPDPASMKIAQDLVEQFGLKLATLGEAMAKNAWENKHWFDTMGWADGTYKHDRSIGEFILSDTRAPFRVLMRPPEVGERGWWVLARTPKAALEEMLREGANEERSVGWLNQDQDLSSDPDEEGMIAVTVEPDPEFMAVFWTVTHKATKGELLIASSSTGKLGGFYFTIGCWYGGMTWNEGRHGIGGVQLTESELTGLQVDEDSSYAWAKDKQRRALPPQARDLPPLISDTTYRTAKDATREAVSLSWAVATSLKLARANRLPPLEAARNLRQLSLDTKHGKQYLTRLRPPKVVINSAPGNPGGGGGFWMVEHEGGADMYWAEDEDDARAQHWDRHPQLTIEDVFPLGVARVAPNPAKAPGEAKRRAVHAQRVIAKLERAPSPAFPNGLTINGPTDIINALDAVIGANAHESFIVFFVNIRNKIVGYTQLTEASGFQVQVDVSGILREALACNAAGFISVHNHPTGDPTPSEADRRLWLRLREAGALLGVPNVDNLVMGVDRTFWSQAEEMHR